ncbi:EpsG family protein [Vagococcus sp. JNUCC 83]
MLYFVIFCFLAISSFLNTLSKKNSIIVFNIAFALIFVLNFFRFGVGSDYFNYFYLYNLIPEFGSNSMALDSIHGEIGYKLSVSLFKRIGIGYYGYNMFISFIMFSFLYIVIRKYSKNINLTLLIYYTMYYFTYANSGYRQGLTLVMSLAILYPLLLKNKYVAFSIGTIIFSLFHTSVLVLFILLIIRFNWDSYKLLFIFLSSFAIYFVSIISNKNIFFSLIEPFGIDASYNFIDTSLFAVLSRLIMVCIIMFLVFMNRQNLNELENRVITYYLIGFSLYMLLASQSLIASRVHVYFKILELFLIPNLLFKTKKSIRVTVSILLIFIIMPIFYVKEINGQKNQANLNLSNRVFDYPYISIFNKGDLYRYREVPPYIQNIY